MINDYLEFMLPVTIALAITATAGALMLLILGTLVSFYNKVIRTPKRKRK